MILTEKGKVYTGATNDPKRRWEEHRSGRGAKYFRTDNPRKMVISFWFENRSEAQKKEYLLKQLAPNEKLNLVRKGKCVS